MIRNTGTINQNKILKISLKPFLNQWCEGRSLKSFLYTKVQVQPGLLVTLPQKKKETNKKKPEKQKTNNKPSQRTE